MKIAKVITWIGLVVMILGLINGFTKGNFFEDGKLLLENPWGIMSMVDLYVGFVLFSMWIFFRERNKKIAIIWIVLMMILGFFTACVYILIKLYQAKNSWSNFFMGTEENE